MKGQYAIFRTPRAHAESYLDRRRGLPSVQTTDRKIISGAVAVGKTHKLMPDRGGAAMTICSSSAHTAPVVEAVLILPPVSKNVTSREPTHIMAVRGVGPKNAPHTCARCVPEEVIVPPELLTSGLLNHVHTIHTCRFPAARLVFPHPR